MRRAFLFWPLLAIGFVANGQYDVEIFSPANGLVDAKVNRIYQDSLGRLFFLTREGFGVYDGKQMKNFTEAGGQQIGVTPALIEVARDNLLVFTLGHAAFRYRNNRLQLDTTTFKPCRQIREAFALGGGRWVLESINGFFLFDGNKLSPLLLFEQGNNFNQSFTEGLYCTNELLVLNERRPQGSVVHFYNWKTGQAVAHWSLPQGAVLFSGAHEGAHYIFGNGLYSVVLRKGKAKAERLCTLPPSLLAASQVVDFRYGRLWLQQKNNRLLSIEPATNTTTTYTFNAQSKLSPYLVFLDGEKNPWLLLSGIGAAKLKALRFLPAASFKRVSQLSQWHDSLWVVDEERRLFVQSARGRRPAGKLPPAARPWMFRCGNKTWWIEKTRLRNNANETLPLPVKEADLNEYYFSNLTEHDAAGNALLSGYLFVRLTPAGTVSTHRLPYYCDNVVSSEPNVYWAFCRNNQVLKFRFANGALQLQQRWEFPDLNPRYVLPLPESRFMVGTRHEGLRYVQEKNGRLLVQRTLRRTEGLSSNFISYITPFGNNSFALSTSSGLDVLRYAKGDTVVEKISAPDNYFNQISETKFFRDTLWVKTLEGELFAWRPDTAQRSSFQPQLRLSAVEANGEPVPDGEHRFGYRQNNFRFEASAPSFENSREILFAFSLQGNDRTWQRKSAEPFFEINNLDPGDYRLQVVVSFPGGRYPKQRVSYAFSVAKPFWQTTGFRVLFIAAMVALIVLLVKNFYVRKLNRQKRLFEKNQAIEKERTRIAADMHDDLGAGLSRIKFLSETLKLQEQSGPLSAELNKISAYSDEMAEKMGEIVWALNQRFDSAGDLVAFCRAYASEFLAEKKIALQFSAEADNDQLLNGETRRNVFLSLKEALHNVAKHSGATQVWLEMRIGKTLYVRIADNGKGFDAGRLRPFSNGLENMKKRMAEIGGSVHIAMENGTVVELWTGAAFAK